MPETTEKATHTPTPWEVGETLGNTVAIWGSGSDEDLIARMNGDREDGSREQTEADADFLCLAVNGHDALVVACEAARSALVDYDGYLRQARCESFIPGLGQLIVTLADALAAACPAPETETETRS